MPLLGIDLGTTYSAIAFLDPSGTPTTIANSEGELTTPSVVLIEKDGDVVVGRVARRASLVEPDQTADYVKRAMGDQYYPRLVNGKQWTPTRLSSLILKKLKQDAEQKIGNIDGAVITVPAYFDEARRQATASAGRIAGLNVIDIINEPTAAALAYAYQGAMRRAPSATDDLAKELSAAPPQTIVVYDLGGGTFDVTVLAIKGTDLRVLATTGDVKLGGREWDERLFAMAADMFVHTHGTDPRENAASAQLLMLACEEAKRVLSQRKQTDIVVTHGGKTMAIAVTRDQFEELTADVLYRTENRLSRALKHAGLTWNQIDQVLAIGGSTRMPQVLQMLKRVTGRDANCSLSPDEAVAHGAAIHAAVCVLGSQKHQSALPAFTEQDLVNDIEPRADPSPFDAELNPGLLSYFKNKVRDLLQSIRTTNVNAHSLGVVVYLPDRTERVSVLIPHDTPLPVSVTKTFGTVSENQKSVTVRVVEGESKIPTDCLPVGACQIQKLPPGLPRASPVEVTFTYDTSARLHVKAKHPISGSWAKATIQRSSGPLTATAESAPRDEVLRTKVS